MSTASLPAYQEISFEDAARIIYYHYSDRPALFKEFMEDLMTNSDEAYKSISPRQYDEYKQFLTDNKNAK